MPTVLLRAPFMVRGYGEIPDRKGGSFVGERTKLGLGIAGAAATIGLLADALLRATPWGLNVLLFTLALVGLAAALASWRGEERGEGRFLVVPRPLFGGLFAAGAVFEDLVAGLFDFDLADLLGHLLLVALFARVCAGLPAVAGAEARDPRGEA